MLRLYGFVSLRQMCFKVCYLCLVYPIVCYVEKLLPGYRIYPGQFFQVFKFNFYFLHNVILCSLYLYPP